MLHTLLKCAASPLPALEQAKALPQQQDRGEKHTQNAIYLTQTKHRVKGCTPILIQGLPCKGTLHGASQSIFEIFYILFTKRELHPNDCQATCWWRRVRTYL